MMGFVFGIMGKVFLERIWEVMEVLGGFEELGDELGWFCGGLGRSWGDFWERKRGLTRFCAAVHHRE